EIGGAFPELQLQLGLGIGHGTGRTRGGGRWNRPGCLIGSGPNLAGLRIYAPSIAHHDPRLLTGVAMDLLVRAHFFPSSSTISASTTSSAPAAPASPAGPDPASPPADDWLAPVCA